MCCCRHSKTKISLSFGTLLGQMPGHMHGWRSSSAWSTGEDDGSPSVYNKCMLFEGHVSIRTDGVWRCTSVIPTMIHFAPLLRARMLRLWRDCALRLWTFIFWRHRIVDWSSITPFADEPLSVALTTGQGCGVEMWLWVVVGKNGGGTQTGFDNDNTLAYSK